MRELRDLRVFLQDLEQTPSRVIHDDIRFVHEGLDLLGRNRISWRFNSLTNAALVFRVKRFIIHPDSCSFRKKTRL